MFRRIAARVRPLNPFARKRPESKPKAVARPTRPLLELLEDRLAPAVVNYNAGTDTLTFTGIAGNDNVTVTTPAANTLSIVVAGDTITLTGDVGVGSGFNLSAGNTQLDINTTTAPLVSSIVLLDNGADTFTLTLSPGTTGVARVTVNGEAGNDTINVRGTALGTTTVLIGGANDDTYNIGSATNTLDALDGALQVFPVAGNDTLTISESGNTVADTVTVDPGRDFGFISGTVGGGWRVDLPSSVRMGGINLSLGSAADTVNVDGITERTTIDGGGGGDTYNVVAPFTLGGQAMGINPAGGGLILGDTGSDGLDRYNIDVGNRAVTVNTGGRGTLTYQVTNPASGLITQNDGDNNYAFTLVNIPANNVTLVVNGGGVADGAADTTTLVRSPLLTELHVRVNNIHDFNLPYGSLANLSVNGTADADHLIVDYTFNPPLPLSGLDYNGGAGRDAMTLTGYNVGRLTSNYTNANSGNIEVGAGAFALVRYQNLEPLTLAGTAADLIINLPAASANADVVLGDDGGPGDSDGTQDPGSSAISGSTFEYTEFTNPTNSLVVNLGNSGDTITLQAMDAAFAPGGANPLTVNGGTGNDRFILAGGPPVDIQGGTGNDTLVGANAVTSWNITGGNAGNVPGRVDSFLGVENLTGDGQIDTFTFMTPGALTGTINGGLGSDRIIGDNTGRDFTIDGSNAGSIAFLLGSFFNVENLTGGSQDDTFRFTGGALDGQIEGGGNTASGDTIIGDNFGRTFTLTGANAGTVVVLVVGFTGVENLTGGTGIDTFNAPNLTSLSGRIDGAAGNDAFNLGGGSVAGGVLGSAGLDAFNLTANTSTANLNGGGDDDSFTFSGGFLSGNIVGDTGSDTITGDNSGRSFSINNANGGTIAVLLSGTFSTVENLTGGTANDTFTFTTPGALDGRIDGGGTTDNDTIVGDNVAHTFTINGSNAGSINGILANGFTRVESLTGGSQIDTFTFTTPGALGGRIDGGLGTDEIVGDNAGRTFNLNGSNAGSINVILPTGFISVENLTAGTGNDTFNLNGGALDGLLRAGLGNDGFNVFANYASNLLGDGGDDAFNFLGGILTGLINGGADNDAIFGDGGGRAFSLTGANAGSIGVILNGSFSFVENLIGGSGADSFSVPALTSLSGRIDGGVGNDVFGLTGGVVGGNVLGSAGVDLFSLTAGTINGSADGGDDNDAFNLTGGTIVGGALGAGGLDTFNLSLGTTTANLNGGTGDDAFNFSLNGVLSGAIDGGANSDTITGDNVARVYNLTAADQGTIGGLLTGGFTAVENLTGGSQNDRYTFTGGSVTGVINGGFGLNEIVGDNVARAFTINGTNSGFVTGLVPRFINIENLTGGNQADTFTFDSSVVIARLSGQINGGAGTDTLTGDNGGRVYILTGTNQGTITTNLPGQVLPVVQPGFINVENLTGGTANDVFVIGPGAGLGIGIIDGRVGSDTLDYSPIGSQTVTLTETSALDGFGGNDGAGPVGSFLNIDVLQGGNGTTDRLVGIARDSEWFVDNIAQGRYVTKTIVAPLVDRTLTFEKIENVTGNGTVDTINGLNTDNNWTIDGENDGRIERPATTPVVLMRFLDMEHLGGGAATDNFRFVTNGRVTGNVDGKAGANEVDYADLGSHRVTLTKEAALVGFTGTVMLGATPSANDLIRGEFRNISSLVGSNQANSQDELIGLAEPTIWGIRGADNGGTAGAANRGVMGTTTHGTYFRNFENLTGNSSSDAFYFDRGSLTGRVNGGGGFDTITSDNVGRGFTIDAANGGRIGGGNGVGQLLNRFDSVEQLTSGTGNDIFAFGPGGILSGRIDGGGGSDTLCSDNASRSIWVSGLNAGRIDALLNQGYANVEVLKGGTLTDYFHFEPGGQVTEVNGGPGGSDDWLNFTPLRQAVAVKLGEGTTLGMVTLRVSNLVLARVGSVEHVLGNSSGGDMLIGNSAANILVGYFRNNMIMGGLGKDFIIGGDNAPQGSGRSNKNELYGDDGEDVLIAGRTNFQTNFGILQAYIAAWTRNTSYEARVAALETGVGRRADGTFSLLAISGPQQSVFVLPIAPGAAITSPGGVAPDNKNALIEQVRVFGGSGRDYFVALYASAALDRLPTEDYL